MKHPHKKTKKFLFPILSLVILSILSIATIITYLNISVFTKHMNKEIKIKKNDYIKKHQERIYKQVHFVTSSITYNITTIEERVKHTLKERVKASLDIAKYIYNKFNGKVAPIVIKQKIAEHLSALQFDNNRGYYVVYDDKTHIMYAHPSAKLLGKDVSNTEDIKGQNLVNLHKKALKENEIGFAKMYFTKPNQGDTQYPKIVAVTLFKPLDLIIGTGSYLDIIKTYTKEYVLKRYKKLKTDKNNYLFILDLHNIEGGDDFATMILNPNRTDLIGKKINDNYKDAKGKEFRKVFLKDLREKGESYTKYWYKKPGVTSPKAKLSYFYLHKDWNWIIASGFYYDDLDKEIYIMQNALDNYTNKTIIDAIVLTIFLSVIIIIIAVLVSLKIDNTIKKYTQELIEKELELEIVQDVAKMGSWSFDFATNNVTWSDETYKIFEMKNTQKALSREDFLAYVPLDEVQKLTYIYENHLTHKEPYHIIHRIIMKNGDTKWVEGKCKTIFDEEGNPIISNGTLQDITKDYEKELELKEKKKLLINQEKLASMGEMIGNIAHQWRQPLSVISTSATGIQMQKEYDVLTDESLDKACTAINNNAQYLSETINDFKNFIKGDRVLQYINLEKNIFSFIHLVEGSIKNNNINVIFNLDDNLNIESYPNELIQCYINIFNNAKDILKEKNIENKLLFISTSKDNDNIIITFKDNAGGIPEDILPKIFDPYFTTKHQSKGTGLGLNMSYRLIVEGMNGKIEASNKIYSYEDIKYTGAEFKITLPISAS